MKRKMKNRAKLPKKFSRKKVRPNFRIRQESWNRKSRRLDEKTIRFFDEMSPGFGE
jgi:hypothetical protein